LFKPDRQTGVADVRAALHGVLIALAEERASGHGGGTSLVTNHKVFGPATTAAGNHGNLHGGVQ
jgi:hypothetical protein